MEYNTTRNHLAIREYGRNVQKMVEYLMTIEDDEKRQKNTETVIELMGMLNPHLRNVEDWRHKLWDHLFLISDFQLKVKSPFPIPTKETLSQKPETLPYPKRNPRFRHFGKNFEKILDKAISEKDPEKKEGLIQYIGNYMKLAYANWHKENMHDDIISAELSDMTGGKLHYVNDHSIQLPDNLFSSNNSSGKRKTHSHRGSKNNGKGRHNKYNKNRGK